MTIQLGYNMENVLKKIVDDTQKRGYDVKIRDIAYALLKVKFNDDVIAYTVVFGTPSKDHDVKDYDSMDSIQYLVRWFKKDLAPKEVEREKPEDVIKAIKKNDTEDDGSISFEENRAGIETQIAEILELKKLCTTIKENGDEVTDVKTLATLHKTEADLRSKLNDKFGASEKSSEQYIVVRPKMNHICEWTHRECWLQTKSFAMEHWHLIPDPNYKG